MKVRYSLICFLLVWASLAPTAVFADLGEVPSTSSAFHVPTKLRGRVTFWRDIFTKYGERQVVIHHRMFPQIIFGVMDLREDSFGMSAITFENFRKEREKVNIGFVRSALEYLAAGNAAQTPLQRHIEKEMRVLGAGTAKYQRVLDEDLVRTQTGIRERFSEAIRRSGRFLPEMEKIFRRNGLPIELTRIPFIESSFDYTANSSVGAVGIWQFMRRTAKEYMTVNALIDERRDPLIATEAAARYLRSAYASLGSWPLAITSYNHGVGGVAKKVREVGTEDISTIIEHPTIRTLGFASNNFYPEFLAALEAYEGRSTYFPEVRLDPPLKFVERPIKSPLSIKEATKRFGSSIGNLRAVNYALSNDIWTGRRPIPSGYTLKIPSGPVVMASAQMAPEVSIVHPSTLTHVVRQDENLRDIAVEYNTSEKQLKELNRIEGSDVIPGEKLVVKSSSEIEQTRQKAPVATMTHTVKKGDSLLAIAKRYGVSAEDIKRFNHLKSGKISKGERLIVAMKKVPVKKSVQPLPRRVASESEAVKKSAKTKVRYTVKKGDTVSAISKRYKVPQATLAKVNKIFRGALRPGQVLTIP